MSEEHDLTHIHTCEMQDSPHESDLGCFCECGAVRHLVGWQEIKTLSQPENPLRDVETPSSEASICSVHVDPEFDVEEYRDDLERRITSLMELAILARLSDVSPYTASNRLLNKAKGIEIALSLLPKKPGSW